MVGTLSQPNDQRTDGPFATLERARDAVRESDKKQAGDVLVLLRGGSYQLKKTVVFGLQDSGQGDSHVTYKLIPARRLFLAQDRKSKIGWTVV